MRSQSPDNNNPANPLFKVAALEIDKEYKGDKDKKYMKVKASLIFKKSDDLRGVAKDQNGAPVNINFGLKIRRASLEIVCADDKGQSPSGFVKISRVAYVGGLATKRKLRSNQSSSSAKKGSLKSSITAKFGMSISSLVPKAGIGGELSRQSNRSEEDTTRSTMIYEKINVTATYAGSRVHWEINPLDIDGPNPIEPFLEGSMFQSATDSKCVDAAHIKRTDGKAISNISVTGSVYINMQDLILENVCYIDDDGIPVALKRVTGHEEKSERFLIMQQGDREAKNRLLKQIIRKHLISQGLRAEGNLVEICRAST